MTVLDELLDSLDTDCPVRDIRQGVFHTAVRTRHCGLASTLPKDALRQSPPMVPEAGRLLEKSAGELAAMVRSDSLMEAAIGMATVNSLLRVDTAPMVERNASEIILGRGTGKNVAVVGHFPFLGKVREKARNLWVIEHNPQDGDHAATEAGELLPRADVVAITGTSLTNHTFEGLLALCRPGAFVLMLGDSVPLTPLLFDHGLDALCGTVVDDADQALCCVSQGGNYRQITGVRRLTLMKDAATV